MNRAYFNGSWHNVEIVDVEAVYGEVYRFILRENGVIFTIEASKIEAWW